MNLNEATSRTLRYAVIVSMIVIAIGLAAYVLDMGENILWLGVLLLILSPLFGIIVSFISLIIEKDKKWASVAAVLLIVVTIGILIAIFFGI